MKIIKPSVIELKQTNLFKHIEICGRTCYKSEDKITNDSAEKFVNMLRNKRHCYDGDTEILTSDGWIKFKEYKGE